MIKSSNVTSLGMQVTNAKTLLVDVTKLPWNFSSALTISQIVSKRIVSCHLDHPVY